MEAMGADDRLSAAALIAELTQHAPGFDLFQAIALLERALPAAEALGTGDGAREAVRLSGHVSLAFEASDVRSVRENPPRDEVVAPHAVAAGERGLPPVTYTLSTPVLTLAGANGPLPMPVTELVLERRAAREPALSDLLDIFNHRFLSFLYRGRKKHAPGLNWQSPHASALAACIDALSNLGLHRHMRGPHHAAGERPRGTEPWLRHAGLMSGAPRSMAGLVTLLADRLGLRVTGTQFIGGWRAVDRADSIRIAGVRDGVRTAGSRVGGVQLLGRRWWDQAAGIRIEFHDLPRTRFTALLPGGDDHALALWLIRSYLQEDFDVQFMLMPAPQTVACAVGGKTAARLGWTSWLSGTRAAKAEVGADAGGKAGAEASANGGAGKTHRPVFGGATGTAAHRARRAPAPVRFTARASESASPSASPTPGAVATRPHR
ncbi:type VI secretion system baseplate subunit TssG [Paraburkholderia rhizosphaerae]|uniref:Type VI secretion system protein ImpH n=1 Tax=Paraburkholderia rhizosphaerae TaxID=480658 RepID=A0A4R8LXQ0_9BURK|nr:type VI secretion system baseplate subunit TssG [Paraburkholderia rhizosphaerae]TDY51466.1 type VI secretion system protein ImpH [Paraburkholderia rhizosphaerae]